MSLLRNLINRIFKNKLVRYLFTRYLTYFLQFITSIIIAKSLGPFYFGIYGFILLLINYFRIFDFGISNATNVLLVQNKGDFKKESIITTNSIVLIGILGSLITIFAIYYHFFGIELFDKYNLDSYFYYVCIIGIIANFNVLFMSIYRVNNHLKEISLYQSIIPYLCFGCLFLFKEQILLQALVFSYFVGNLISLIVFVKNKGIPKLSKINLFDIRIIISKSFYLFLYNLSFYLIIVSIRTLISIYYSVEEFGYFSFAYSLANSILLFLQALTFIIFPKVLHKLKGSDLKEIDNLILNIRNTYVTLSFGLIFLGSILYPFLLHFIPQYESTYTAICLCALSTVLYTNSFGYVSFLMAQNQEKLLAVLSIISLIINLIVAYILINYFKATYDYVIISTMIAYVLYTFLCTYYSRKLLGYNEKFIKLFLSTFPLNIFLPFIINVIFNIINLQDYLWLPFTLFILLNFKNFKEIYKKIKLLINNPNAINI